MAFVVDNSVVVGWCFHNQASAYADRVLDLLASEAAYVPGLWVLEFSNVLRKAANANKITLAQAEAFADMVGTLPLVVDYTPFTAADNMRLAIQYGLSSYDATYLALALRLKIPVAASDGALREAAKRAKVGVVE